MSDQVEETVKHQSIITNGFTRKTHIYQILSYLLFFGDILIFYLFLVPLLHNAAKIAACIIFIFPTLSTIYSAYICTNLDPTDPIVTRFRRAIKHGQDFQPENNDFYCMYCKTYVNESSRHCKRCDRCVHKFDHHCKWVNNCIGGANYKQFILMIVSVLIFAAVYLAFMIVATINFAHDRFASAQDIYSHSLSVDIGLMVVVWVFSVPSILLMILDFNLLAFHVFLMKKKMTTFDYIIAAQEKKEQEDSAKLEKRKQKEQNGQGSVKGERTCFDFVLCLNKKRKIRKGPAKLEPKEENQNAGEQKADEGQQQGKAYSGGDLALQVEEEKGIAFQNPDEKSEESEVQPTRGNQDRDLEIATHLQKDSLENEEQPEKLDGFVNELRSSRKLSVKIKSEEGISRKSSEQQRFDHLKRSVDPNEQKAELGMKDMFKTPSQSKHEASFSRTIDANHM